MFERKESGRAASRINRSVQGGFLNQTCVAPCAENLFQQTARVTVCFVGLVPQYRQKAESRQVAVQVPKTERVQQCGASFLRLGREQKWIALGFGRYPKRLSSACMGAHP